MDKEDRESEEIDIEPFEGEPEFKSSGVLNDDGAQDDEVEASFDDIEVDGGGPLGGEAIGTGQETPDA